MKDKILFFGLTTWDLVYTLEEQPQWDSKNNASSMIGKSGGPSFGAARAASLLGQKAILSTAIGKEGYGNSIHQECKDLGIHLLDAGHGDGFVAPLASVVGLPNGERTVFTTKPTFSGFDSILTEIDWSEVNLLCLDGHYLEDAIHLAKISQEHEIPILLDGGSWKEGMDKLLPFVNEAIVSQYFSPPGCSTAEGTLGYLKNFNCFTAMTRGGESILLRDGKEILVDCLTRPKQTNGAGDVLHGAYAASRNLGISEHESLLEASKIATNYCLTGRVS